MVKTDKLVKIRYRGLYKYDNHHDRYQFQGKAKLLDRELSFIDYQGNLFRLKWFEDELHLINEQGSLKMKLNQHLENDYQTSYGKINLTSYLTKLDIGSVIKIKYDLYHKTSLLVKVYLMIQIGEESDERVY